MNKLCVLFVSALIAIAGISVVSSQQAGTSSQAAAPVVTDVCLGCICEAVSGCDRTLKCSDGICGLFGITWAYWADSGKPTLHGRGDAKSEDAFPNCVNDPFCAAESIQRYMNRFGQDCNGDGTINCLDYAAIHLKGGYGCKGDLPSKFSNTLNQCLATAAGGGLS